MSLGGLYRRLAALTPEQRAAFAHRLEASGVADHAAEITRRTPGAGPLPASLMQQRLWLVDQMNPASPFYNLPLLCFRLRGPLGGRERRALAAAATELARRHESLRTTFAAVDGAPVQVIAPPEPVPLPLVDLAALPAAVREDEARRAARDEGRRPCDLAQGPLWRTTLLRLDDEEHLLLIVMHHIISDGWSLGVLYRELAALYGACRRGLPSPLPELPVQFADFALWQRRRLSGEFLAGELAFWRGQLEGAPEHMELPIDRPRPRERTYSGRRRILALPPDLPAALTRLAESAGGSLYMALLTGFDALLHRLTGQDDLVLGSPVAGRGHLGTEGLIGFFVNTVVFRVRLSGEITVAELLGRAKEVVLDVYEHQELPFDRVVEEVRPRRSTSYGPVFQTMLGLQNIATGSLALDGFEVRPEWIDNGTAQTELILFAGAQGGRLTTLQIEYNTDLFDDTTIARMEGHLLSILAAAAAAPETRLADLPLLSPPERHQLLEQGNALAAPLAPGVADDDRLERRFLAQTARRPDAVAIELGDAALTYGELLRRAGRLAARLSRLGAGPEAQVALCLPRTLDMPVAIVAALLSGGAYLPLDPAAPPERLRVLLEDSGAPIVVTTAELAARLPGTSARLVLVDREEDEGGETPQAMESGVGSAESTAYVIYTSGSTGRPNGVRVAHRTALRLFAAAGARFAFGPEDVWTIFHSYVFDFTVWELWGALLHGGRAVLLPTAVARSPEALLSVLAERRVTLLAQTPPAFRALSAALAGGETPDLALRAIVFAGEALYPEDLRIWMERFGERGPRLVNMFGPTETTVVATYRAMTAADLGRPASPLGAPLEDLSLHLLDRGGNLVPIGVPGEICIGGAGVARGYLARPELTAERFVPDPFSPLDSGAALGARQLDPGAALGARLYRSGDLGRRLPDGDVVYLGRIDLQVKVRGVRIELGEIEAALARHPGVAAAAVALAELAPGERGLVAYVVPAATGDPAPVPSAIGSAPASPSAIGSAPASPAPSDLRAFLRTLLPEVMVPAAFVELAALPLTVNGKLDRRALPAPERLRRGTGELTAPRTPVEESLASLWRELLGVERVGTEDDFFELGGHSLLASRLAARLRDRLGVELSAQHVFRAPTIATLSAEVERLLAEPAESASPRRPALVRMARPTRRSAG